MVMKHTNIYIMLTSLLLLSLFSCNKSEDILFDTPFVSLEVANSASAGPVNSDQEFTGEYLIYLNTAPMVNNVEVTYEIEPGNGLLAGRDFELITKSNTLIFYPGIYDMSIRIKWLRTCVRDENGLIISDTLDDTKDTSLTIRLISNTANLPLGYPGPDQLKKEVIIKKEKAK